MTLKEWIKADYGRGAIYAIIISALFLALVFIIPIIPLIPSIIFLITSLVFSIKSFKNQGFNWKALIALIISIPTSIAYFFILLLIIAFSGGM